MTIEEAINIIETSTYLWLRTTDLERTALSMALEALTDRKTEPTGYNLTPVEDEAQTKTTTGTDCSWK